MQRAAFDLHLLGQAVRLKKDLMGTVEGIGTTRQQKLMIFCMRR